MKSALILSLFAGAVAIAGSSSILGTYIDEHEIAFMSYDSEDACVADHGRYEDGLCFMAASDDVTVRQGAQGLTVEVNTITTNGHMCSFEGAAVQTDAKTVVAETDSEEYDPETQTYKPAKCRVTVTALEAGFNSVSVDATFAACSQFCGANAALAIAKAVRK